MRASLARGTLIVVNLQQFQFPGERAVRSGEPRKTCRSAPVGPRDATRVEPPYRANHLVTGYVGVTVQESRTTGWSTAGWNMGQKKSQATSLEIEFDRPRVGVAVSPHNPQRKIQRFKRIQRGRRADITQVPDLFSAFQAIRKGGRVEIVSIRYDCDAHRLGSFA